MMFCYIRAAFPGNRRIGLEEFFTSFIKLKIYRLVVQPYCCDIPTRCGLQNKTDLLDKYCKSSKLNFDMTKSNIEGRMAYDWVECTTHRYILLLRRVFFCNTGEWSKPKH